MLTRILCALCLGAMSAAATTLSLVTIFEPVTLHGTDVDDELGEGGAALQAAVVSRPMALSGAFPETLAEAVRTPHQLPTNDPNYAVEEVNLLVLCRVGVAAEIVDQVLEIGLDVGEMAVPGEIDMTERQVIRLAIIALRKTLETYQEPQMDVLKVRIEIRRAEGARENLGELACGFEIEGT